MNNIHLRDIVLRAQDSNVTLEILGFIALLVLVWVFFRKRPEILIAIIFVIVALFSSNELLSTQRIEEHTVENFYELVIRNSSSSPVKPKFQTKMILSLPLIFSGGAQIINMIRGDCKYTLSKTLSTSLVINSTRNISYRSYLTKPLPEKVLFLCQHIPYLFDTLPFLSYIPDTHKLTVFNDFTMGGMSKELAKVIHVLFCKHLYGARMISRRDRSNLKTQITDFVNDMVKETSPHVFAIWPSGWAWRYDLPNGIEAFKPGAFYMSVYANIPVCIIHGKISKDSLTYMVEQSDIIYPPSVNREGTYEEFYDNQENKQPVEQYRSMVESIYRNIDNELQERIDNPREG
jgi:hypothetical protein